MGEMGETKQGPSYHDRDERPVAPLNRPLQVAAECGFLDNAGDGGARDENEKQRHERDVREVGHALLRYPDHAVQHAKQEYQGRNAKDAGEKRRPPDVPREAVGAQVRAPCLRSAPWPSRSLKVPPEGPQIQGGQRNRPRHSRPVPKIGPGQGGPRRGSRACHYDPGEDGTYDHRQAPFREADKRVNGSTSQIGHANVRYFNNLTKISIGISSRRTSLKPRSASNHT